MYIMDHTRLAMLNDRNSRTATAMSNRKIAIAYKNLANFHRSEAKKAALVVGPLHPLER
jgi:hypothetical protein